MQVLPLELGLNNNTLVENRRRKMNASYFDRFRDLQFQRKCQNASQIDDGIEKLTLLHFNMTEESARLDTIQTVLYQHEFNLHNLGEEEDIQFLNTMMDFLYAYKEIEHECKERIVYWQTLINDSALKNEILEDFYKNPNQVF